MVGGLKRYKRDPNGKGRGAGLYYHRGNGVYSKRDLRQDYARKAKTRNKVRSNRHTHDLNKKSKRGWL
jgi:hypothetical protein